MTRRAPLFIVFSFVATVFAAASLAGCVEESDTITADEFRTLEGAVTYVEESDGCRYKCKPCPPNRMCTQVCEPVGNCNNTCDTVALCAEGYTWDEASCSCRPSTGESCGAVTCGAGQVCCNASCGICTAPGEYCTMQVCGDSTSL